MMQQHAPPPVIPDVPMAPVAVLKVVNGENRLFRQCVNLNAPTFVRTNDEDPMEFL